MKKIIILFIFLTSCYSESEQHDVISGLPSSIGVNDNIVIITQEHIVIGTSTISSRVDNRFDRSVTITNDTLIETDTLYRNDILYIGRKTNDEVNTKIYASVYRYGNIYKVLWATSGIVNKDVDKVYRLN